MKNINKGLGFLAVAAVSIVAIIVTQSLNDDIALLCIAGFGIVGIYCKS